MNMLNHMGPLGRQATGLLLAASLATGTAQAQAPAPQFQDSYPLVNRVGIRSTSIMANVFEFGSPLAASSTQGLKVFSAQRGGQRAGHSGTVTLNNSMAGTSNVSTLNFQQTGYTFRAGETVSLSVTTAITNTDSMALALVHPAVLQFRTEVGGTGRGDFRPGSEVPVVAAAESSLTADLDNDGDLDLVTFSRNTNVLSIYRNNGAGVFASWSTVPTNGIYGTGCVAVGDVDNDGDLDLVASDLAGSGGTVLQTLLNNGTGGFSNGTVGTLYYSPSRLLLGDLDGDGDLDLVSNMNQLGTIQIRYNDGTGTFPGNPFPGGPQLAQSTVVDVALVDVDVDYDLDIVAVANGGGNFNGTLTVLLNGGDASGSNSGVFTNTPSSSFSLLLSGSARGLAVGDLDGDYDVDVAALVQPVGQPITTEVLLNASGTAGGGTTNLGTFGNSRLALAATDASAVALADVDADGDLDVLTTGANIGAGTAGSLATVFNSGLATFGAPAMQTVLVGAGALALTLGDVDNDGDLDALTTNYNAHTVSVRLNGPGPEINVKLGTVDYLSGSTYNVGNLPTTGNSVGVTFTLQNLSLTDTLTVSGASVTSSNGLSMGFGIQTVPFKLAPGSSAPVSFSLGTVTAGPVDAQFVISSNDLDEPGYVLNFSATGIGPPTAVTWTGAVSTDWATAGNWNPAYVPTASMAVAIPPTPNQPVVSQGGATAATVATQPGTTLTIVAGGYLTLGIGNVIYSLQANGAVVMTGGTLEAQGLYTYFNGGLNATGGTVVLSGTNFQEVGTNGGGCTFWNLTVGARAGNQVRAYGGGFAVRRVLRLEGDIENNSSVNLLSDASGTAMVVNAGGRVMGTGSMQRYISGPNAGLGYRHLSAPSPFASLGSFYGAGFAPVVNPAYNTVGNTVRPFPNFFGYDESRQGAAGVPGPVGFDQGWVSPATTFNALAPGRGYTMNLAGTVKPSFSGFLSTGPVVVGALSRSGTGTFAGYHLLGNPYPSPIDWDSVAKPAGLDNAVYVFRSTSQYAGFYDSYVNGMGTLAGGEIAAMQGFFVRVSQPVAAFSFTDAARRTTYTSPTFRRGAADTRPTLALALRSASGGEADKAFIYFETGATATYDARYDAAKLPNPGGLGLASLPGGPAGGQEFAINGLPLLGTAPLVLPLSVTVPAAGTYELAAEQLASFAPGTTLYLRDALTQTLTLLTPTTRYAFTLAGTSAPGRFSVEFRPAGALATAAQVLEAQVQVFPNPARAGVGAMITLPAQSGQAVSVTLLNTLGQTLSIVALPVRAGQASGPLPTAGLAAGVYVLRVQAGATVATKRLVIE